MTNLNTLEYLFPRNTTIKFTHEVERAKNFTKKNRHFHRKYRFSYRSLTITQTMKPYQSYSLSKYIRKSILYVNT